MLLTLLEGLQTKLSDFEVENATPRSDYFGLVVEILIGGVPTVLDVHVM